MTSNEELDKLLARELEQSVNPNDSLLLEKLEIIGRDYKRYLEANLDTCERLEHLASEDNRAKEIQHHRIMGQLYKQILDNYVISKRYHRP